ncbi:MAG TPA: FAD-dependent oxidoreductase [Patescibacteria group bacterium]|nr:FAD-dependent oxidoreductase [Patescibacteria group bacterium]
MVSRDPVVIVGGGLSGMTALYENLKNNIPTVLYEKSTQTVGGVIRSRDVGNKSLDMGGELVDSTHTSLLALCREVGLEPVDTLAPDPAGGSPEGGDNSQPYYFDSRTGTIRADAELLTPDQDPKKATGLFIPLAEEIKKDYAQMGKTAHGQSWLQTPFNQRLDRMSAQQYLDEKCRTLAARGRPVDPAMIKAIENAYQCENGRDLKDISALVFVNQIGQGDSGKGIDFTEGFSIFGNSDERYKIPGGTAALVQRLQEKCEQMARDKGFPSPIQLGQTLKSIERGADGRTTLNFHSAEGMDTAVETDYVISAMQAPVLGAVPGAENLGLSQTQLKFLRDLQYTNSSKVFFEVNGQPWKDFTATGADGQPRRITDSDGNFYGDTIKESWLTGGEEMTKDGTTWITCLVGGDENAKYSNPKQLIEATKQEYARILGKNPDDIFKKDGRELGTAVLSNKSAGGGFGCYASPGLRQGIPLVKVSSELARGTTVNGKPAASFAGSWLASVDTSEKTPGIEVGFMNVGVESAQNASAECVKALKMQPAQKRANDNTTAPVIHADAVATGGITTGVQPGPAFKRAAVSVPPASNDLPVSSPTRSPLGPQSEMARTP